MEDEKKLIADILAHTKLVEMPTESKKDTLWVRAIARVKKSDFSIGYAVLKRTLDFDTTFEYSNGSSFAIVQTLAVYPFEFLHIGKFTPSFRQGDIQSKIAFLKTIDVPYGLTYTEDNEASMNKEIVRYVLYKQLTTR